MSSAAYKDRVYTIVPYDPAWPAQFEAEAARIRAIFGPATRIEHIGSTAVPGMAGKSCIDALVIVDDLAIVGPHAAELEAAGYSDAGEFVVKDSRLFRKMAGNEVLANIHFFPAAHPHVKEMLAVRDYLRAHPDEVKTYSDLKLALFKKYAGDYGAYRKEKDLYMAGLMRHVRAEDFPATIDIQGERYERVDVQRLGTTAIYKNAEHYLRIGDPQKIGRDLAAHKHLEALGFPVPKLLSEGRKDEWAYFAETSLGEKHFADIFIAEGGSIRDARFAELLDVCVRFAEAQLRTAVQEKDWAAFRKGIHLEDMREELPQDADAILRRCEQAEQALAHMPFVMTHGDFTPWNVYPQGVIDFEDSFMAPAGYDLAGMVQHLEWFSTSKEYETYRLYDFTSEQRQQWFERFDALYTEQGLPPLSTHLTDFNFVKGLWHAAHMQHQPKLQQFRYAKLREFLK